MNKLLNAFGRSARLEWRYLTDNRWDKAVLIWLPLCSIAILWWIFAAAQPENIAIAVVDHDRSSESRALIRMLEAAPGLHIACIPDSNRAARKAIRAAQVYAAVIIPADFSRKIKSAQPAPVGLQVNAQYGTHSGIIQRDVRRVVATFSAGVAQKLRLAGGQAPETIRASLQPLVVDAPFGFNITTNYQSFIAAGLIPALLHILAAIAGAYGIGRELRDKTFATCYRGSLNPAQQNRPSYLGMMVFLHGKLCWSFLGYSIWGVVFLSLITYHQGISVGAWWLCFLVYLCLISISLWLGVLLTAVPVSLRMGLSATALITAPAYAFSGMTFPLQQMPEGAQLIANILPITHYLHAQVMLIDMHAPLKDILPIVAGMSAAGIVIMLIANAFAYRALCNPQRWGER